MPVYKDKRSKFYTYEFQIEGHRFYGPTKKTSKREALNVEESEREKAKKLVAKSALVKPGALTADNLTIDLACGKYWTEVGQFHAGSDTTWTNLQRLIEFFGPNELLKNIDSDLAGKLISWRRGQTVPNRRKRKYRKPFVEKRVANATVNRSALEPLKKLFNRAQTVWGIRFFNDAGESTVPNWKKLKLAEPEERVRELKGDELERHQANLRSDYAPYFAFVRQVGPRLRESLIRWSEVDFDAGAIETKGKGGRTVRIMITTPVLAILRGCQGQHHEFVFTYVCEKPRRGEARVKGVRYPITYNGAKSYWKRHRKRAGLTEGANPFRFHDFRHDLGTKLLRKTGNLKLVQKALNHRDIKTTTRYAHVQDDDLREGLESVEKARSEPRISEEKKSTA